MMQVLYCSNFLLPVSCVGGTVEKENRLQLEVQSMMRFAGLA